MMNKTFDTFISRNYPKQIFTETQGQLVDKMTMFFGWQERNLQTLLD